MVYSPAEDSFLLAEQVKKHSKGTVLDVGSGSGIQAFTAVLNSKVESVLGIDISMTAVKYCQKHNKNKNVKFIVSNLFSKVPMNKFDTIIFNPPYLPYDNYRLDRTVIGGKNGFETVEKFLSQANDFLSTNGRILLLFSSFTDKKKVDSLIRDNLFDFKLLSKRRIFFEELYVYKITKSRILKWLDKKSISNLYLFAKGKRGIIYKAKFKNKHVAIKIKNPLSLSPNTILRESNALKLVNKWNIGPKFYFSYGDASVMEFIKGILIKDWVKTAKIKDIKSVLLKILNQCKVIDDLGLSKEEMHSPLKHIIIQNNNPVLIDFERLHNSHNPKNVSQFVDFIFLLKPRLKISLSRDEFILASKHYKAARDLSLIKVILENKRSQIN